MQDSSCSLVEKRTTRNGWVEKSKHSPILALHWLQLFCRPCHCIAVCSQHNCPPRLTTIIHKLCVLLLHCQTSTDITFCFCVALELGQRVASGYHSPEPREPLSICPAQLTPPTGIKHTLPTLTALKSAHWQKHHGAAPSSPCHTLSHSSLSSSAVQRAADASQQDSAEGSGNLFQDLICQPFTSRYNS